jgi:hypothetical protein
MSETTLSTAPDDAGIGVVPPDAEVEETGGDNRRNLKIIGAVVGAIVILAAAYLLLHKSSSSSPTASGLVPKGTVRPAQSGAAGGSTTGKTTKATVKVTTVPKVAKAVTPKDPFKPLVTPPVPATGAATSTTTVSSATTSTSTGTGTTTPTTTSAGTTPSTGASSSATTPQWIQLMAVKGNVATFDVGYPHHKFRVYHVQAPAKGVHSGTVFDGIFALLSIHDGVVSLQQGDATPYQLSTGVSHTV